MHDCSPYPVLPTSRVYRQLKIGLIADDATTLRLMSQNTITSNLPTHSNQVSEEDYDSRTVIQSEGNAERTVDIGEEWRTPEEAELGRVGSLAAPCEKEDAAGSVLEPPV